MKHPRLIERLAKDDEPHKRVYTGGTYDKVIYAPTPPGALEYFRAYFYVFEWIALGGLMGYTAGRLIGFW